VTEQAMLTTLLPAMCCNLGESTNTGTSESGLQKGLETPVYGEKVNSNVSVRKSRRVGRPRIYEDVDTSKLSLQERRKVNRCRANRESARRVREAKASKVRLLTEQQLVDAVNKDNRKLVGVASAVAVAQRRNVHITLVTSNSL
jgi:hypothetical protein